MEIEYGAEYSKVAGNRKKVWRYKGFKRNRSYG